MNLRVWIVIASVLMIEACKNLEASHAFSYKLIKTDAKSQQDVITRRKVANVAKCKDFAENKRALAFNFERSTTADSEKTNCILLSCPEINGLVQLINETGVDYYSSYEIEGWRTENASISCVEKVGLFVVLSERQNFTNARAACRKLHHGYLADVSSESRSRGLAALLYESTAYYVGLSNEPEERIWKNELGNPLACSEYRAWDSGEPSHSRGCVGLIQTGNRKIEPVWRVISCKTELPYICEIPRQQQQQVINTQKRCLANCGRNKNK